MCGRFLLTSPADAVAQAFGLAGPEETPVRGPRYNIAPGQHVLILRHEGGVREAALVRWGLIPHWARETDIGNHPINCRIETADTKPAFRRSIRRRRCLVPADGFFEWKQVSSRVKQPLCIRAVRPGESVIGVFAMAGLWDRWEPQDTPGLSAEAVDSCTIVTTQPNTFMQPIHDRMPAILRPADYAAWLGDGQDTGESDLERLRELCRPYPSELMTAYAVGRMVNSPRHDDPRCIEPARVESEESALLII